MNYSQQRTRLMGRRTALAYTGDIGRTTQWRLIGEGVYPPGIPISTQNLAWFQHELDQWNAAKASGASDDELRELVKRIKAARMVEVA